MESIVIAITIVFGILLILMCINTIKLKNNNKSLNEENQTLRRNITQVESDLELIKRKVMSGDTRNGSEFATRTHSATELRNAIITLTKDYENKYIKLQYSNNKLLQAYMIERKKSQIEIIEEIENHITTDYNRLKTSSLPPTDYIASAMADYYTIGIKDCETTLKVNGQQYRSLKIAELRVSATKIINQSKRAQYFYESVLAKIFVENPKIGADFLAGHYGTTDFEEQLESSILDRETYIRIVSASTKKIQELKDEVTKLKDSFDSNLKAIPYASRIIADIMTIDIDKLALSLSWGENIERKKKVASLLELRRETAEEIERIKGAEYQLAYILNLYPVLQDILDVEFSELDLFPEQITNYDPARQYVDNQEWKELSESERNQLALDRYIESRKKSKWQIGRDYELYCGYCFEQKGFNVDYFGSYNGKNDLGRDLILTYGNKTTIVQCKYWSKTKQIHENHIMQLYGSMIEYTLTNQHQAKGILITNTILSEKAKEFAKVLGVEYQENIPLRDFPRIKCNIGLDEFGEKMKIYHLPFDQQYDSTKISKKGEFMAFTVAEAERAGFRRAYKWHGDNC